MLPLQDLHETFPDGKVTFVKGDNMERSLKVSFTIPFLNFNGPISYTLRYSKSSFVAVYIYVMGKNYCCQLYVSDKKQVKVMTSAQLILTLKTCGIV